MATLATLATVAEVLAEVETDLPDAVIQRYLDAAEDDVRDYLTSTEVKTLPVEVWTGKYTPTLGVSDGTLTLPASILGYPWVRFEGTVVVDGKVRPFSADTDDLDEDGGSDRITPALEEGTASVSPGVTTVAVSDAFLANPALSPVDITTSVAIAGSGDGYIASLLPDTEFAGPILAGEPFFTEWEGSINFEFDENANIAFLLHTQHAFGPGFAKTFDHVRSYFFDVNRNRRYSLPLNIFDSISTVRLGSYTPADGDAVEITAADLMLPSRIRYDMEIVAYDRRSVSSRKGISLSYLHFESVGTISYQREARRAVSWSASDSGSVADGAFEVTIDDTGKELTVDTSATSAALTVTRVLGLQQAKHPARMVNAVMDLVHLAVQYRGIDSERVGQYSVSTSDYHRERNRVLGRLVYASDKSLAL